MKKILIVSTVSRQFYLFEQGNIEVLKSLGYQVHAAANFSDANERLDVLDIIRHPIAIERSPLSFKNIKAYKQLKKLMKYEKFDAVHCHSPVGGVLARLAAKSVGLSNIIYTAHGFHFYKGSPLFNWIIYYPIEKILSKYTDILITINQEDYNMAQRFNARTIKYIPGIGVDINKFKLNKIDRDKKRKELGLPKDAFVILSVGELNRNKNHEIIIKALAEIKDPNVIYIICGQGKRKSYLEKLITSLKLSDRIKLLGYRDDISNIYKIADLFAFPSYREGLSVALMEAMVVGLPVICSKIRGNIDLIDDKKGGYLIKPNDLNGFINSIIQLRRNSENRESFGFYNSKKVIRFGKEAVKNEMKKIYNEII